MRTQQQVPLASVDVVPTMTSRPSAVYLLASSPYPPVSGNKLRSTMIARALGERFDVTVVALDDLDAPGALGEAARRLLARRQSVRALAMDATAAVLSGRPVLLQRSIRAGCSSAVAELLRRIGPDLVLLGRPLVGPYAAAAHAVGARVVIDADERMTTVARAIAQSPRAPVARRLRAAVEGAAILSRTERRAYRTADQLWVSADPECDAFQSVLPSADIRVVPNAVEMPDVLPACPEAAAVAFVGWYRYPPNEAAAIELAADIMPAVRAAGGPSRLVLIGPDPTPAMRRAARGQTDTLTGEVPDVRSALRDAGILAVPIRSAGGTRVKILDAIACGVPVVSTGLGIAGLGLREGTEVLVAETPGDFAVAIRRLANDASLRASLAAAAFGSARARFSPPATASAIFEAVGDLAPDRP